MATAGRAGDGASATDVCVRGDVAGDTVSVGAVLVGDGMAVNARGTKRSQKWRRIRVLGLFGLRTRIADSDIRQKNI